jgi:UDP-2,4-diacetamido-2,4,6-trideoxy-beta-L-altropyranose hydrolase
MEKYRVVLRADGNRQIGFGHIYRLLALADILKDHFYLVFALHSTDSFIEQEIEKSCSEIFIIPGELPFKTADQITAIDEIGSDIDAILTGNETVVLDGYYFGTSYQEMIKEKGCKLICIDDLASNYFVADAVINHAPGIEKSIYKTAPYTKLYTGLEYAILRKPFFQPPTVKERDNRNVFISLGGSDYFGITVRLVNVLREANKFNTLHVMCSSSFPAAMMDQLQAISKELSTLRLHINLSADEIVNIMDDCQCAFVSASTVLLEAYSRGLICFAGFYTNNQLFIYNGFLKENKAIGLGNLKELSVEMLEQAFLQKSKTIDIQNTVSSKSAVQQIFLSIRDNS